MTSSTVSVGCRNRSLRSSARIIVSGGPILPHASLHFKRVDGHDKMYFVRISIGWRTLGLVEQGTIYWAWFGSHAD